MIPVPISILDLAAVAKEESVAESFAGSVRLAQSAERGGYERVWYAEHHNISSIASSATAVLIAHIAAHTETIRLGAGGVMLPNHSPLQVAEQPEAARRLRARAAFGRGRRLSGEDIEVLLRSPQAAVVDEMLAYTAVGTAEEAAVYLERFQRQTGADELITAHYNDR